MTEHRVLQRGDLAGELAVFPPLSRANFAASYPEGPHKLRHNLSAHPLLELEALADLADPKRDRRGTLRSTLLAYLETGGSHVEAATALGIHRNTLSYR